MRRYLQAMLPVWFRIDTEVPRGGRARPGMLSLREAARQLEIPYPSVAKLLRSGEGAGIDFEEKIAALRFDGDVTALRRAAREWADAHPERPSRHVEPASLERVVEIAARLGRPAADAIDVKDRLAAYQGEVTEEVIVRMFSGSFNNGTVVREAGTQSGLDDFRGGKGDLMHRGRARKKGRR